MQKPDLKICGLTRTNDVELCLRLGVRYVGFNFCAASKRCLLPLQAANIWRDSLKKANLPQTPTLAVGVVCDFSRQQIRDLLAAFPEISIVQCHGYETDHERRDIRNWIQGRELWQAFRVASQGDLIRATAAAQTCDRILLDAASPYPDELGGSGLSFDWTWLNQIPMAFILAGGVKLENIDRALALKPVTIDICSGVETAPGIKDHELMQRVVDKLND